MTNKLYITTGDLMEKYNISNFADKPIDLLFEKSELAERRNKFQTLLKKMLKEYDFILDINGSKTYQKTYIKKSECGFFYINIRSNFSMRMNAYHVNLIFSPYIHHMHEAFMASHTTKNIEEDLGITIKQQSFAEEQYMYFDVDLYETDDEAAQDFIKKIITKPITINPMYALAEENYLKNKAALEIYTKLNNLAKKWLEISEKNEEPVEEFFEKVRIPILTSPYQPRDFDSFAGSELRLVISEKKASKLKISTNTFYKWWILSSTYFDNEDGELEIKHDAEYYSMTSSQFSYMLYMTFIEKYMQD